MEISEIKKKIMEKIEKEKASSGKKKNTFNIASLSERMGRSEEDIMKLFNKASSRTDSASMPEIELPSLPLDEIPQDEDSRALVRALETENVRLKRAQDESAGRIGNMLSLIRDKDKSIEDLFKKLGAARLEEENKKLKSSGADAVRQNEKLFFELNIKDKEIAAIKKKLDEALENAGRDKDLALGKLSEESRTKYQALEAENKKFKKLYEVALKQSDGLLMRIEEKDKEIAETEISIEKERSRAGKLIGSEKIIEELKEKLAAAETENKLLRKINEDALKQNESLLAQQREREKVVSEELKKAAEEVIQMRSEKDKAFANSEGMRSKLYTAAKDLKEQASRVSQLDDTIKIRDKKIAEHDKVCRNIESEKNAVMAKLQASEESAARLEEKLKASLAVAEAKERKLQESEKTYFKNIENLRQETEAQIQSVERGKKILESKISQLIIEQDAKDRRIGEIESTNAELDGIIKDLAAKLRAAENAKSDVEDKTRQLGEEAAATLKTRDENIASLEKNVAALRAEVESLNAAIKSKDQTEEALRENIANIESEIETRDRKIQTDIKYCEGLVREVNDLRQKIKAYRLKAK